MLSHRTRVAQAEAPASPVGAPVQQRHRWAILEPQARRPLLLLALSSAILLPEFAISSRLPHVRIEQLLLPYALLVFAVERRRGRPYRLGALDYIFLALGISTLVSVVGAPLILHTRLSPRDFFELLKPVLYYCYYRLALSAFSCRSGTSSPQPRPPSMISPSSPQPSSPSFDRLTMRGEEGEGTTGHPQSPVSSLSPAHPELIVSLPNDAGWQRARVRVASLGARASRPHGRPRWPRPQMGATLALGLHSNIPFDWGAGAVMPVFLAAGSLSAAFGVFQYFDWLRVNEWLTPFYAPEHHLTVLQESGRVVGTISNPNYFAMLCAILALGALASFWLQAGPLSRDLTPDPFPRREGETEQDPKRAVGRGLVPRRSPDGAYRWLENGETASAGSRRFSVPDHGGLLLIPAFLACLGLVFSGSRSGLLALAAGLLALGALALWRRRALARFVIGSAVLVLLFVLAAGVAEAFPHGQVDFLGRVTEGLNIQQDASFGLRIARWRAIVAGQGGGAARVAGTSLAALHRPLTSVHATGAPPAAGDMLARDAQRKADLLQIAQALDAYHQQTGNWPDSENYVTALVPAYLPAVPRDPLTHETYRDVQTVSGYSLLARLENPADPDYNPNEPIYGIGSGRNYLLNGDLEAGGSTPSDWETIPGTSISLQRGDALYGDRAVLFRGNPKDPQQTAGIYQQRYFGRPGGQPFTATVWVKLLQPASGTLELYANVVYTDGDRADPLTRIAADMNKVGVWQKVTLGILPASGKEVSFMGIYVIGRGFRGQALVDGFQLVDGPVPLSFAITGEAPSLDAYGFNPEANFRRSPLIGVGPAKAEQGGAVDDEYLLYAARYGLIGIAIYLALYFGTLTLAARAFQHTVDGGARLPLALRQAQGEREVVSAHGELVEPSADHIESLSNVQPGRPRPSATTTVGSRCALPALVVATLAAFLIFNVAAGSFYELQLMAIFWLLTGAALGMRQPAVGSRQ